MKKEKKILTIGIIAIITITAILLINSIINPKNGGLKEITYNEINQKLENKENFILIISQSTCSHCATYKPKVEKISKEHNITTYYIDYDKLSNKKEFLEKLNLNGSTPITLFFENGKEKSVLNRIEGDLSSKTIEKAFTKMGFIEK